MRLLLDEMYSPAVAEQLRARGHDAVSLHEPADRRLEGADDADVFAVATAEGRVLVTENVGDFRRLEADALAHGKAVPGLLFTTDRQFPRGDPATLGRLVVALVAVMEVEGAILSPMFLKAPPV